MLLVTRNEYSQIQSLCVSFLTFVDNINLRLGEKLFVDVALGATSFYNVLDKVPADRETPSPVFRAIFLSAAVIYRKGVIPRCPRLALALEQLLEASGRSLPT